MLELVDYYEVLQIAPAAEPEVVRAAYRALAAKYHPDVVGGDADRMVEINRAWAVLSDAASRTVYDKGRTTLAPRRAPTETRPEPAPADGDGLRPRAWPTRRSGTVLDFGRYAGWSFGEIAAQDPDFLRWLARMPIGRPYVAEIERTLAAARPHRPATHEGSPGRFGVR